MSAPQERRDVLLVVYAGIYRAHTYAQDLINVQLVNKKLQVDVLVRTKYQL